eukprot:850420-Rhodomonas_salina.2
MQMNSNPMVDVSRRRRCNAGSPCMCQQKLYTAEVVFLSRIHRTWLVLRTVALYRSGVHGMSGRLTVISVPSSTIVDTTTFTTRTELLALVGTPMWESPKPRSSFRFQSRV